MKFDLFANQTAGKILKFLFKESQKNNYQFFDELDDYLVGGALEQNPSAAKELTTLIDKALIGKKWKNQTEKKNLILYNKATLLLALLHLGEHDVAIKLFKDTISPLSEKQYCPLVKTITSRIFNVPEKDNLFKDTIQELLSISSDYFFKIGDWEEYINIGITAAYEFSGVQLFQAAYRHLDRMQDVCMNNKRLDLQAKVLEAQACIAFEENDFSCAATGFNKAIELKRHLGHAIDDDLLGNYAITLQNLNKITEAQQIFEKIFNQDATLILDTEKKKILSVNYLINLRHRNDPKLQKVFQQIIDVYFQDPELFSKQDNIVFLTLIRTSLSLGKFELFKILLDKYLEHIDVELCTYFRLQYRRGVKEKYIPGLLDLLQNAQHFDSECFLKILSLVASNSISDWVQLNRKIRLLQTQLGNQFSSETLLKKLAALVEYGAPISYGPKEKYEDPFDMNEAFLIREGVPPNIARSLDNNIPWSEFIDEIVRLGGKDFQKNCYSNASISSNFLLLREKNQKSILIYSFFCNDAIRFVICHKETLKIVDINSNEYFSYLKELFSYNHGQSDRGCFSEVLQRLISFSIDIATVINSLVANDDTEILHFSDHVCESFPMLAVLMQNSTIRERFKCGSVNYCRVPILCDKEIRAATDLDAFTFVFNPTDSLLLVSEERQQIETNFLKYSIDELNLSSVNLKDLSGKLKKFGLHFAGHCLPFNMFSDPFFISSSRGESQGISLEEVQRNFYNSEQRFVFINACCSGTSINRNYHKNNFKTNESLGLVSAFMTNGLATVISTQWKVTDIACLITTILFYRNYNINTDSAKSMCIAMATLYDLSKDDLLGIISEIKDENIRKKYIETFTKTQTKFPFRHPLFYGCYTDST